MYIVWVPTATSLMLHAKLRVTYIVEITVDWIKLTTNTDAQCNCDYVFQGVNLFIIFIYQDSEWGAFAQTTFNSCF